MDFTAPIYSKSEILTKASIPNTTFNNWRIRRLVPFGDIGIKKESLRTHKYSPLVLAYLICLKYHTGSNRRQYVETLKQVFRDLASHKQLNEELVIAISGWGAGADCGVFKDHATALSIGKRQSSYVHVGMIIKQSMGKYA